MKMAGSSPKASVLEDIGRKPSHRALEPCTAYKSMRKAKLMRVSPSGGQGEGEGARRSLLPVVGGEG